MTSVGIAEAKDRLPELIRAVEGGEQVLITRHGVVVAQLGLRLPRSAGHSWVEWKAAFGSCRDGTIP